MRYGVIWHPASHNLGDDLQTLAAGRLLPRIDTVLDGERLDEAPGEPGEDIITLMGGHAMRRKYHWPPHPSLRPVCLGLHLSREDAWGCPMEVMEGVGLDYLRAHGPVGCRDDATADLLDGKITFHQYITPFTPAEDIEDIIEFDPDALSAALN